jgi:hypothetical protein
MEHMNDTIREPYVFRVTNFESGTPFVAIDALERTLPCFSKGHIAFDLRPGISQEEAERFAQLLNAHIVSISYTSIP